MMFMRFMQMHIPNMHMHTRGLVRFCEMASLPLPARLLLSLGVFAVPSLAELTAQEAHECRAHPELIAFELRGGVALEICLMLLVAIFMYVLIEEYYVPAIEVLCSKDVLNIPKPIVGCTVMAAGNCLPELSISLVSILADGQDIGTGEVLGSCVFDLLAMLGVVCLKLPKEGARMPLPLVLYFLVWVRCRRRLHYSRRPALAPPPPRCGTRRGRW